MMVLSSTASTTGTGIQRQVVGRRVVVIEVGAMLRQRRDCKLSLGQTIKGEKISHQEHEWKWDRAQFSLSLR